MMEEREQKSDEIKEQIRQALNEFLDELWVV
jgi:hypothetical protein